VTHNPHAQKTDAIVTTIEALDSGYIPLDVIEFLMEGAYDPKEDHEAIMCFLQQTGVSELLYEGRLFCYCATLGRYRPSGEYVCDLATYNYYKAIMALRAKMPKPH
jgi:hypothetical protein